MDEQYVRVTYDCDYAGSDPIEFCITVRTSDYWTYAQIASFVQKTALEKQKSLYADVKAKGMGV